MQSEQILQQIKELVEPAASILLTGAADPDGDALGSQLALYDIFRQHTQYANPHETCEIIISNEAMPPAHYHFLPHFDAVVPFEEIQEHQFDVGFILDSHIGLVGEMLPVLQRCRHTIVIDHHQNRQAGEEDVAWIEPGIGSVAEMIYRFLEHPEWHARLNADIAACLYAGIIYDTGNFSYPNTTSRTHRIVAEMFTTGIDFSEISLRILLERSFAGIQLQGEVLRNVQRDASGEIIWGVITQEMLARLHATLEESEGIISRYTFARGAKVAVLFKETAANEIKLSFRSKGALDVARFARSLASQGGGHDRAAGCTLHGTIQEVQQQVIPALQTALREN